MTQKQTDSGRRQLLTGLGTLAAASLLPHRLAAQGSVNEAEILIIGGGMAGGRCQPHMDSYFKDNIYFT